MKPLIKQLIQLIEQLIKQLIKQVITVINYLAELIKQLTQQLIPRRRRLLLATPVLRISRSVVVSGRWSYPAPRLAALLPAPHITLRRVPSRMQKCTKRSRHLRF